MALNFELMFTRNGETVAAYGSIEESLDVIIRTIVEGYVSTTNTDDMDMLFSELIEGTVPVAQLKTNWENFHEKGFVEQMIAEGTWVNAYSGAKNDIMEIFGNEPNTWTVEIDITEEYVRFYNSGEFISSIDFVELDEMNEKTVREKCSEIATNGATVNITKLTMSECGSIKSSMKMQQGVLTKLLKAIEEGRKHPRLIEGISEKNLAFTEKYCRDMVLACDTMTAIAENAEKILKPIEDAKKKAEEAKRKAKKDLETDTEGEEKPKKRKRRAPRKKKAPVKIAQAEISNDITEEIAEEKEEAVENEED